MCLKNICDCVGGQDKSNGTPLDPPLFWLDNIYKQANFKTHTYVCGSPSVSCTFFGYNALHNLKKYEITVSVYPGLSNKETLISGLQILDISFEILYDHVQRGERHIEKKLVANLTMCSRMEVGAFRGSCPWDYTL